MDCIPPLGFPKAVALEEGFSGELIEFAHNRNHRPPLSK
jgi:hypothetical protein